MKSFERFFLWDPEGDGFETFATEAEMLAASKEAIERYLDGLWSEDVEHVVCGRITHKPQQTDVRHRQTTEDGEWVDEDGEPWHDPDADYTCNYEMQPIDGGSDEEEPS